jgi:myo-inositol 2-dehydrogenase / D-chiro-inositol 1-dehydrogenase
MKHKLTRRGFMQTSAGLTAAASTFSSGFTIVKAASVRGTTANSMVEVGWIGLGGRGTRDAYLLEKTGKAKIVAVADYFQYRIDNLFKPMAQGQDPETVQRPRLAGFDKKNAFVGVDAYQAITGSKVDAVLMATPPGFRPEHFKAAVAAKKHVFMEKPLAVDAWGCHIIDTAGKQATANKLSVVVGLQRHYSKAYRKCKELIDSGAIGDIVMAHSAWDTGDLWPTRRAKPDKTKWPTRMDYEVEHWYFFKWLSGDHIVEQSIHNLDVINWMLNAFPVRAHGTSSRRFRKDIGDIHDNFNLVYEYASSVTSNHTCIQVDGTLGDISETIRGTKGTFTTTAGKDGTGGARIDGVKPKRGGDAPSIYKYEGIDDRHYDQEALAFVESVLGTSEHRDDTDYGMKSTFTAILGREAAYRRQSLDWTTLWNAKEKLTMKPVSETAQK